VSTDTLLTIAHHLAVFTVLALLAIEWAIVRPGLDASGIKLLARVDAAYGISAMAVVGAGIARVVAGAKPSEFYTDNPTFWVKMAAFAIVGLLSIRPTITYLRWRRALDAEGSMPSAGAVRTTRRSISTQLTVLASIPVLAVLMARGVGG
jgi:putative membrane protein